MPDVASELHHDRVHVTMNGILHVSLVKSRFLGLQAWRVLREQTWFIECTMDGGVITLDYDAPEKWQAVLAELKKHL